MNANMHAGLHSGANGEAASQHASTPPAEPNEQSAATTYDEEEAQEVEHMAGIIDAEPFTPGPLPVYALPDQEYLEGCVLPLLVQGLQEVAKARPPDPLAYLGAFLLMNNPQRTATPLLHNADGHKVPLETLAERAAAIFDPSAVGGGGGPEEAVLS